MSERLSQHEYGDLIFSEHWRLQNIKIEHTHGEKEQERGWNSVFKPDRTYDEVKETIDSSKTPFEPLILLVPPQLLGTHEATDPEHPDEVPNGYEVNGFSTIHFESGLWKGPAIAVAAFCVCEEDNIVTDNIYPSIVKSLSAKGGFGLLGGFEYGDLLILDGHHRNAKAIHEGFTHVPVQIIPYLHDASVILKTWHYDEKVWKGEEVFACAKTPGKYADAKRTKFGVLGTDGVKRRILDALPNLTMSLRNLKPEVTL